MRGSLFKSTVLLLLVLGVSLEGRVVLGGVTDPQGAEGHKIAREMAPVRKRVSDKKAAEDKKLKAEQGIARNDAEKAKKKANALLYRERRSLGM